MMLADRGAIFAGYPECWIFTCLKMESQIFTTIYMTRKNIVLICVVSRDQNDFEV